MTIFEIMLCTHLFADYLLQTEWQAVNKSKNLIALGSHIAVYHLVMLGVLVWRFGWDMRVLGVVAFLALTHAVMDRGWVIPRLMRALRLVVNRPAERWLVMVVDQVIHILLLGIAALILG
jgi:hypothetical protein